MHPLVDFLNHGILPFTGRGDVAEKITSFWRGATEAHGLQVMLLIGEAGIGKSRMVEEIGSTIKRAGGAVVHTKLYPESATSIAPLVARAIWRFSAAHPLLKMEPEEDLPSVIAALRRLVRLRQTLLIFEDIHLLDGEGLADFATLLDALADEHVAVLCLARPVELGARALLERHLVDDVELLGLGDGEVDELWKTLFGVPADRELVKILLRATTGNPLAIRSALRGALKSGAIAQESSGTWRITLPPARFEETLARNVRLLSEGMAAHLTEKERHAAEQVASLGEVLSREAAIEMIGGDESLLGLLAFKGIVVETGTLMPPLSGKGSAHPLLAFTHTLLHRRLAENATADVKRIVHVVINDLPIYSSVPFALLAEHAAELEDRGDELKRLVLHVLAITRPFDGGPDWKLGLELWKIANTLYELHGAGMPEDDRFLCDASLHERRMRLLRGMDTSEEYLQTVLRFAELTDRPLPAELIEYRMHALRSLYWLTSRRDYAATKPIRDEVEGLVARYPQLRISRPYVEYLARVAHASSNISDRATIDIVENELATLASSPDVPEETRRFAWRAISPYLLLVFSTPEELERRLRLLAELEKDPIGIDSSLRLTRITFLINVGHVKEAREGIDESIRWYRDRGQYRSAYYCAMVRLYCDFTFGGDAAAIEEEAIAICEAADEVAPRIRLHAATYFAFGGILRGIPEWSKRIAERLLGGIEKLDSPFPFGFALGMGDEEAIRTVAAREDVPFPALRSYMLTGDGYQAALEESRERLAEPAIRMSSIISDRLVIDAIEYCAHHGRKELAEALKDDIHTALIRSLTWLDDRGLLHYIAAWVGRFGGYLTRSERTAWNARLSELAHEAAERNAVKRDIRIALSMLGAIEVSIPGQDPTRPRGVRLRTLLGLMVADRMLEKPLSQREFCRLAASDAVEFEDARKTVNLAVHRLREMLGHDAILTDHETPRINRSLVEIDLLRAHHLLIEVSEAIRDGSLPRAYAPLLEALEITRGEVPFPTLYDDFFEAAREDFENRMRSSVLRLAKGLLLDGDAAGAEEILRRAFAAMPDDEEIGELLSQALVRLGKRIEAERVRMQADGMACES